MRRRTLALVVLVPWLVLGTVAWCLFGEVIREYAFCARVGLVAKGEPRWMVGLLLAGYASTTEPVVADTPFAPPPGAHRQRESFVVPAGGTFLRCSFSSEHVYRTYWGCGVGFDPAGRVVGVYRTALTVD